MKAKELLFAVFVFTFPFISNAQSDTLIRKLDSVRMADTIKPPNNIQQENYNEITKITFHSYFLLLGSNIKQQFTSPLWAKKKDWSKVGKAVILGTALYFADKPIQKGAVEITEGNSFLQHTSRYITNTGGSYEIITLGALTAYGMIFKAEKIKTTALLASHAYITSALISTSLKFLAGRQRPVILDEEGKPHNSFHGPFYQFKKDGKGNRPPLDAHNSFPSGHATAAFAAATVFAKEYRDRPMVPIFAYTAASLISLSRLTENRHWASDVLIGAGIGYLSGLQIVNNFHRYAKLKYQEQNKGKVSFNLQYMNKTILPGMVYTFRN
ncbi:MAG TPA: phosphatase PAP2 family protein [Flavitalea sp.]|nr:phosphatase PAP2 family protein [Flavitalea sp.]